MRRLLVTLVAAPGLVLALAQPGNAATTGVVVFGGTLSITPTASPGTGTVDVCFSGLAACPNTMPSTGIAAGVDVADVVDGIQARATYTETCAPITGLPATGSATLTANVHRQPSSAWSAPFTATWQRVGLVAVIQGDAIGAALFAPLGPAACGQPLQVAVVGAAEFTG